MVFIFVSFVFWLSCVLFFGRIGSANESYWFDIIILIIASLVPSLYLHHKGSIKWLQAPFGKKMEILKSFLIMLVEIPFHILEGIFKLLRAICIAIGYILLFALGLCVVYSFIWVIGYILGNGFKSA